MLFWLGSIEFETPWGRFILTADSAIRLPKRRRATKVEAAQIWPALEARLMYASYDERLPWYELYWELTSERLYGYGYGPGCEPHVSNLLRTIELALWSEQLHLEVQEPYDPLPELDEWEPPPLENLRKYIPPQSPSEIWKRKSAIDTFIGICLKDQNGDPVVGSRVRVKLPDGKTQEGKTDTDGELQITGLTVDGKADITLLDFAKAGKALPIQPDPPKEFKIVVVDETGKNGVADVAMVFSDGATPETIKTDSSGTATYETQSDSVSVNFESRDSLANAIKPIWKSRPPTKPEDYAKPGSDVSAVELRPATIDVAETKGDLFKGLTLEPDVPQTITVRPPQKRAVVIEMRDTLFRNDSAVVNPEGEAPSKVVGQHEAITTVGLIATILRYNEEHPDKKMFIAGHTDRAGEPGDNDKLSMHRGKAVWALVEGKKDKFVEACIAKHSEVDVTQLMDWTNKQYNFTCKPTTLTANPSDENYYRFRTSYNKWVKGPLDNDEKGPRGTKINDTGRLQPPDIWKAMFDLYEHNLRQELGEDEAGVSDLRGKLVWVDDGKKYLGYGEKHPTAKNTPDGSRVDADRRVEVMLFDDGEEPNLAGTNGEEIFDPAVYKREHVPPMVSAKKVECFIRCLGYDDEPVAAGTAYAVQVAGSTHLAVAGEGGIAALRLGAAVAECELVEWEGPSPAGSGTVKMQRAGVKLLEISHDEVEVRLANLGYTHEQLDERVTAFQRDWGQNETGNPDDVLPDVKLWHDEGQRPDYRLASNTATTKSAFVARGGGGAGVSSAARKVPTQKKGASLSPGIIVKRYRDANGNLAPAKVTKKSDQDMWYLEILRGQHTAIALEGAPGLDIRSNNLENAVPGDRSLWIDKSPGADPRNIFFYGQRVPLQRKHPDGSDLSVDERNALLGADQVSMFEVYQGTTDKSPTRTLLQVKVVQYPKPYYALVKLFGKVQALNAANVVKYELGSKDVDCKADPNHPNTGGTDLQDNLINSAMWYCPDHLVIAAHGSVHPHKAYPTDYKWKITEVLIGRGDGLNRTKQSLDLWDRLHGKVKYIWFMNCNVGADCYMFAEIARRTGAWVSAASESTEKPINCPKGHIEYVDGSWRHWNGKRFTTPLVEGQDFPVPDDQDEFFRSARYKPEESLEPSLHFNIVRIGGKYANKPQAVP